MEPDSLLEEDTWFSWWEGVVTWTQWCLFS
jgi:hypothetical protein